MNEGSFLLTIRAKAKERVLFLPHAVDRMSQPNRMVSPVDVPESDRWTDDFTKRVK